MKGREQQLAFSGEDEQAPRVCTQALPRGPEAHRQPGCSQGRPQHPGCAPHVCSFTTALKSGLGYPEGAAPTWAGCGGCGSPRGQGRRGKWSVHAPCGWMIKKFARGVLWGSLCHVTTRYSEQRQQFGNGVLQTYWGALNSCPVTHPQRRLTSGFCIVFLLVKQALPSPCTGSEAGLFPGNKGAQRPPAPHWGLPTPPCWGYWSYFKGGGDSTAHLDALGGSLSLWKARGANLPLPWCPAAVGPFLPGSASGAQPPASWSTSCSRPNHQHNHPPHSSKVHTATSKHLRDGTAMLPYRYKKSQGAWPKILEASRSA
uniref:Uncharacterized protein LOC112823431 n=1 Tax=Callorhinus ursinus TaxID=34884 RepID=A0A3Q7QFM5_CALUR|nr:uncharacterized protein LOC112823431 [Callorhinus ursinus]